LALWFKLSEQSGNGGDSLPEILAEVPHVRKVLATKHCCNFLRNPPDTSCAFFEPIAGWDSGQIFSTVGNARTIPKCVGFKSWINFPEPRAVVESWPPAFSSKVRVPSDINSRFHSLDRNKLIVHFLERRVSTQFCSLLRLDRSVLLKLVDELATTTIMCPHAEAPLVAADKVSVEVSDAEVATAFPLRFPAFAFTKARHMQRHGENFPGASFQRANRFRQTHVSSSTAFPKASFYLLTARSASYRTKASALCGVLR